MLVSVVDGVPAGRGATTCIGRVLREIDGPGGELLPSPGRPADLPEHGSGAADGQGIGELLATGRGDRPHTGLHVLQHFLSRVRFDTEAIRRSAAAWTVEQIGDREVMLVVDETGDEKSSPDAVGASRQYSGALGGIGLCQVTVHLSYVSAQGHALIDRCLYLGEAWADDDERGELAGVPDETTFAAKPQLAGGMLPTRTPRASVPRG
ncbi:transposase [Streptomyces sp. CB02115]|uniref:transposase n=1 Tax=Streptomyces sp. CB02115 TaxID=1703939 RepID=UPI000938B88E|nr:transposase [Streptomyces sp. CB02115]